MRSSFPDTPMLREFHGTAEISEHEPHRTADAHRHFEAYAAIALHGEYTEVSADGCFSVRPGDVVVHPPFHRHGNVFSDKPVAVLNVTFPNPAGLALPYGRVRLDELPCSQGELVHQAGDCIDVITEAIARTRSNEQTRPEPDAVGYAWQRLKESRAPRIRQIAAETGISAEHLARTFRARYGLSPADYRAEHRFRHALKGLVEGHTAAAAAFDSGYSDQAHMTRDFRRRIGMTPMRLARRLEK